MRQWNDYKRNLTAGKYAVRQVILNSADNFRDLGGYKTAGGPYVKQGKIFRSSHLANLTENDQTILKHLGLKMVCDFRTDYEVEQAPDRLPRDTAIEYVHLPVTHGEFNIAVITEKIKKGDTHWLTEDFMIEGYKKNIDRFAHAWGTVIQRLSEKKNLPLVFHCNSGKDRAGTCAALTLLALGVAEKTIIQDYLLSNIYLEEWVKNTYKQIGSNGIETQRLKPLLIASPSYIAALLEHIHTKYGGATDYLKRMAGIREETLFNLKENLLE